MVGGQLKSRRRTTDFDIIPVQSFREPIVWQKSMGLVRSVYELSKKFPSEERFGLASQIRRAVVSIPSNIAEGQGRNSTKEFLRHLSISYGSLMETETQILIAEMQMYVTAQESEALILKSAEIGRMINGLVQSLERKIYSSD
ncbi:MAG: four helix bundle protein [Acidobacteriota bacterium]